MGKHKHDWEIFEENNVKRCKTCGKKSILSKPIIKRNKKGAFGKVKSYALNNYNMHVVRRSERTKDNCNALGVSTEPTIWEKEKLKQKKEKKQK